MGRLSRRETKRRLRLMAQATVDMERGTYVWSDGRAPVRPDGTPVVERKEIMRFAGYSPTHDGKAWFDDPYYLRHLELERKRRDGELPELVRSESLEGRRLVRTGQTMLGLVEQRLKTEPEKFSNALLVNSLTTFIRYGLELMAHEPPDEDQRKDRMGQFNTLLGDIIVGMDASERDRLTTTQEKAASARLSHLKAVIDATTAAEEEEDAAGDVVDVTQRAESS